MSARNHSPLDGAALLEHRHFVACVARRLLRDDHDVDDAVQETWLAALRSPPPRTGAVRAWLAGIARNVARQRLRRRSRLERRERVAARPEGTPPADEAAERLVWQQRVVQAVLALDEPYRACVLLRYYDELPPRAIARELDVSVHTVRTRLRRGLALLRGRLDREQGGRAVWSVALAGLAALPAPAAVLTVKKVAVVLALLALGTGTVTVRALRAMQEEAPPERRVSGVASTTPVAVAPVTTRRLPPPAVERTVFRGRLHADEPAGVVVHLVEASGLVLGRAVTDETGAYRIEYPKRAFLTSRRGIVFRQLLYLRRGDEWSGPYDVFARGYTDGQDLRAEWRTGPRFRFVPGAAGARLRLRAPPSLDEGVEPGELWFDGRLDASGAALLGRWPPWRKWATAVLEIPGGDRLDMTLERADEREVRIGAGHTVTLRARVLGAPGARVRLRVPWRGYRDIPEEEWVTTVVEGNDLHLFGRVPDDGGLLWRFPAGRPEQTGTFPGDWHVLDESTGLPRLVTNDSAGVHLDDWKLEVVGSEITLPEIRVPGPSEEPYPSVLIASAAPLDAIVTRTEGVVRQHFSLRAPVLVRGGRRAWRVRISLEHPFSELELRGTRDQRPVVTLTVPRARFDEAIAHRALLEIPEPPPLRIAVIEVTGVDGRPVAGAKVTARPTDVYGGRNVQAVTGPDGRARLELGLGGHEFAALDPASGEAARGPGPSLRLEAPRPLQLEAKGQVYFTSRFQELFPTLVFDPDSQGRVRTTPFVAAVYERVR